MDSITQIALGAAVGETVLGKEVGNKAVFWGAVAGTIPDLDAIPGRFMETVARLENHRGFSHSIIFCLIFAPIIGVLIHKIHGKDAADQWDWTKLVFWGLLTHPLLDCFTTWGTQLFWPFDYRVAFKTIFVVDPLYTLPLLVCILWLLFQDRRSRLRRKLNLIGLALSTGYLLITVLNMLFMKQNFEKILSSQNIEYSRFTIQPTPLNNILWTVTAETKNGFYVGYHSFLDSHQTMPFIYLKKNYRLIKELDGNRKIARLKAIMNGYLTVDLVAGRLRLNDLRFGLINGWSGENARFVFSYDLRVESRDGLQTVIVEQRRPEITITRRVLGQLWRRIRGI